MFGALVTMPRKFRCRDLKSGRVFERVTDRACTLAELIGAINQWNRQQHRPSWLYYLDENTAPERQLGGRDAKEIVT